jgi:hypothetical protein
MPAIAQVRFSKDVVSFSFSYPEESGEFKVKRNSLTLVSEKFPINIHIFSVEEIGSIIMTLLIDKKIKGKG